MGYTKITCIFWASVFGNTHTHTHTHTQGKEIEKNLCFSVWIN